MDERVKLGSVFLALLAIVVSGCYAYHEVRYLAWGRKAPGVVTAAYTVKKPRARRSWDRELLGVKVDYTGADGKPHAADDKLPISSKLAPGDAVVVEYIPGEGRSGRLEGNREYFWLAVLPASLVASVILVGMLVREANGPVKKKRRPASPGPPRR